MTEDDEENLQQTFWFLRKMKEIYTQSSLISYCLKLASVLNPSGFLKMPRQIFNMKSSRFIDYKAVK